MAEESQGRPSSLGSFNRILTTLVLLLAAASAADLYLGLRASAGAKPITPVARPAEVATSGAPIPSLDDIRRTFLQRSFWGVVTNAPPPRPGPVNLHEVIRQSVSVLGISWVTGREQDKQAIVMDNGSKKMHFLKPGDTLPVGGVELRLKEIQPDRIVLTDGVQDYVLQERDATGGANL